MAILQTPDRFRTKRQLWAYRGLAIETHGSGEYRYVEGRRRRCPKALMLRGLNRNHHHDLQSIFKSAAVRASTARGPFQEFYQGLLAPGRKPSMARLTWARKIAAITLIVWKKGVRFDGKYLKPQAA